MGNNVPNGYLSCNGSIYNIADYSNLAEQIKQEFGTYNYYGGDGVTTFAVPDLRGEFLRGTGPNSHTNQGNGIAVGKHQDSTAFPMYAFTANKDMNIYGSTSDVVTVRNSDGYIMEGNIYAALVKSTSDFTSTTGITTNMRTIRPTNTSVLYCIKY